MFSIAAAASGEFRFADLHPGSFLLTVASDGFEANPRQLELAADEDRVERIELTLARVRTEVVVTAQAGPASIDTVSRAVDVVRDSDWKARGVSTLAAAIEQTPGLRVQSLGGPGGFARLVFRGVRAQDTAVTIDGMRFRDAAATQGDAGGFLENLAPANAQRIELLRGSGSALYGTNAIGGVINIVTDEASDQWHGELTGEGGGLGFGRGLFRIGGPLARTLHFSAGIQHTNVSTGIDGQDPFRNSLLQTAAVWRPKTGVSLTGRFYGSNAFAGLNDSPYAGPAGVLPAAGVVRARAVSREEQRRIEAGAPASFGNGANLVPDLNDPDSHRASRFASTALVFSHQIAPRASWRVRYQNLITNRRYEDGPVGARFEPLYRTEDRLRGQTDTVHAGIDVSVRPRWRVGGGYEWEREDYRSRSRDAAPVPLRYASSAGARSHAATGYAEGSAFGDRLHLSLAGRLQHFALRQPGFDGGLAPFESRRYDAPPVARTVDAGAAWILPGSRTKLRAHAGNGYRAPSIYERFGTFFFDGVFTALGDPRLKPDRTVSLDAGVDQYLARDRVRLAATYFYTDLRQVVGFDSSGFINPATDPFGRFGGYFNTNGATARGLELQTEAMLPRRVRWTAAYTYTNSLQRQSTAIGNDFFRSPLIVPHQFTSNVAVPVTRRLDVTASAWIVDSHAFLFSRRAFLFDGGRKVDIAASYRVPFEKVVLRLQARAWNILNSRYLENGFRTPGAWATGGFTLSF